MPIDFQHIRILLPKSEANRSFNILSGAHHMLYGSYLNRQCLTAQPVGPQPHAWEGIELVWNILAVAPVGADILAYGFGWPQGELVRPERVHMLYGILVRLGSAIKDVQTLDIMLAREEQDLPASFVDMWHTLEHLPLVTQVSGPTRKEVMQ